MNVFVYPEYYEGDLSGKDIEIFARRTDANFMRMTLLVHGQEKCSYKKLSPEGGLSGGPPDQAPAIFPHPHESTVIGLLCCHDIQRASFLQRLKDALRQSGRENMVIALSALRMTGDYQWRRGGQRNPRRPRSEPANEERHC